MADAADGGQTTTAENTNPATDTPSDSEPLGESGKKALEAERKRANAAEKNQKSLQQRIDELEAEKLSKEERANKERDQAIKDAAEARAEALRYRIATKFHISDEDADLFLTGTDEDTLTRQAQRLAAREDEKKPPGLYVPAEGHQPSAPALNSDGLQSALEKKLGISG